MYKQNIIDCKICNKRITANVWNMHVVGKKHLHYTPNKITVTGTFDSNRVDEVHAYFSGFGTIGSKSVMVQDGKVAIEYCFLDKRVHSKIIYKEHRMFNQIFKITWDDVTTPLPPYGRNLIPVNQSSSSHDNRDKAVERKPPAKKIDSESSKRAILETIKLPQTFADQVSILQNNLQADKDIGLKKKLIQDDISAALSSMFSLNKIYFFGSSVTGLDMQGSDLDIYIANVRENNKPEVATLKVIRYLIFKCRKFCDVLLISGAKIPIIKCIHTKTQICCDLNIKNKLSVCNSQLIKYYLSLDDKLRPLMIIIKYWAECYDLKKVNYFSSYAIYMMIIFYLQHEPYNIPSVRELQRDVSPDLVEGWNCAFATKEYSNPALKNESMANLVAGFWRFYSSFDYISNAISPYLGFAINKTSFLKPYDLPEGYDEYAKSKHALVLSSGIIIQDPFEHARNVAASVPFQCVGRFITTCKSSLQLMTGNENELLFKILSQKIPADYSFQLTKPDDKNETEWTDLVKNVMVKILTEILNMKIVQTKKNPICYNCTGEQNIWDNRVNIYKNLLTQLPADTSEVDREIAATKCIIKYFPQTLPLNFTLELAFKQNPCRAEFVLKQINKKSRNFLHAAHFFSIRLAKYIECPETMKPKVENLAIPEPMDMDLSKAEPVSPPEMTEKDYKNGDDDGTGKKVHESQSAREPSEGGNVQTNENEGETSKSDDEKIVKEEDEEEEDVPADFFDDFSNQDFMDGLDIVDAWDEEKLLDADDDETGSSGKDKKHSPIRFMASKSPERRVKKHRSKSLTRRYKTSESYRRRSRSRSRDKLRMDRRDPEKTKRDINKDKIKCAKDREQKIVNDKLRIVETGLVPPGTEMDVDLSSILRGKESRSGTGTSSEKIREARPEPIRETRPERERERRYARRSGSRELRKPMRRSPTPPVYRPRVREPIYRPRKRTTSIDSNLSDREQWIRSARKRTRSRTRDRDSPRHSKSKKYEEAKKKKTFLEEIRDKLNETRPPQPVPVAYGAPYAAPAPQPIPAPVPAPNQYFPPAPVNPPMPQYDQSFFIGDAYQPQNVMNQPQISFGMVGNAGNVMHMQQTPIGMHSPMQVPPAPVFKPKALVAPKVNILSEVKLPKPEEKKEANKETIEDIDKLFADKKISLSDFLAITAKCEVQSSSPEHLQKKIKVISRCQDAIRAMSDDRKFTGRLSVKPSTEQKNKTDVKYQSPLRRIPVVRFQFTSPAKITEDVDTFALALDKILQKVGVLKDMVDLEEVSEPVVTTSSSFADEETASLSLRASLLSKKSEKSDCEECKKRKTKTFAEVGSQCADNKETVSISTQVTEEDLNPKPKNESIAYLTPAQLLGKEKEPEKAAQPPTPEKIGEKKMETSPILKKEKPKPPSFKTRGFRKTLRDRAANNYYDYDYEEEFYDRGRPAFEDPRENFGNRYGGPPARFPRQQFMEDEVHRLHQFREEGNFTDFAQPFRGRGGRMPSRF